MRSARMGAYASPSRIQNSQLGQSSGYWEGHYESLADGGTVRMWRLSPYNGISDRSH